MKMHIAAVALLLSGATATYIEQASTKFDFSITACANANLGSATTACSEADGAAQAGKNACDAIGDCNTFIRNSDENQCYLYSMTASLRAACSTAGNTHTRVFADAPAISAHIFSRLFYSAAALLLLID